VVGFDGNNQPLIDAVAGVWAAYVEHLPPAIAPKKDVMVETRLAPVQVKFAYPTAIDAVDGMVPVSCRPPSGSLFPFGRSPVACTATDSSGNTGYSSFGVVVRTPTTPGAVTPPGNLDKPLTHVDPGQSVRVTAGGFAPGVAVQLSFTTSAMESIDLGAATAASDGRIDVRVKIPDRIPGGSSQVTAMSQGADGAEFVRAWLVTVDKGSRR
jgi:hypothetical protein